MQYVYGIAPSPFAQIDIWVYFNYRTVTKRSGDVTFEVLKLLDLRIAFLWDITPYAVTK